MELLICRIAILLIGSCFNVADLGIEHIKFDLVCFTLIVGSGNFFLGWIYRGNANIRIVIDGYYRRKQSYFLTILYLNRINTFKTMLIL